MPDANGDPDPVPTAGGTPATTQPVPGPAAISAPLGPPPTEPEISRCSTRIVTQPVPDYCLMHEGEQALSATEIVTEPLSYTEALKWEDFAILREAMEVEMRQHAEVGTWELAELPAGKNLVGS